MQRRIQRYGWDRAAAYYESSWQWQLRPAQDLMLQMAALQPGERVIEIACGTGLVSFRMAETVGKSGFILATDISEKMLNIARQVGYQKNIDQVQFSRMEAESLDVPEGSFNLAACALGLMYVPRPIKALQELHRALLPGGRAVAAVWGQRDQCGWAEIFEIVDKRVSSEVCPMFFNLGNKDMLKRSFEAAGFKNIRMERLLTQLAYATAAEACAAAFEGGPVALAYFKFEEWVKEEVKKEYLHSIKVFQEGEGYLVPGEFVIASGYK